MKKLVLVAALLLPACAARQPALDVGVAPPAKMPELPQAFRQKAERLPDIADRSLGGVNRDGINTDMRYNDLSYRYNALVDAWGCVRESLNNRSTDALKKCFNDAEGNTK